MPGRRSRQAARAGLKEILAGLHVALEGKADAQHKHEVEQHDQPIDKGELQGGSFAVCMGKMRDMRLGQATQTTVRSRDRVSQAKNEKVFMMPPLALLWMVPLDSGTTGATDRANPKLDRSEGFWRFSCMHSLFPRFSSAFTVALLSTGAAFTQIAAAQASPETATSTSSPVAYIYVQTKKGIDVFSASSTGKLTQVKGSLFADTGQMGAINGSYLVSVGKSAMYTYPIEANGAVGKQAFEVSTVKYDGSECGTNLGGALFDHTGKYVYVLLSTGSTSSDNPCSALQSYKIESNGELTFLGEAVVDNGYHGLDLSEGINTISGNDIFAYGVYGDVTPTNFNIHVSEAYDLWLQEAAP